MGIEKKTILLKVNVYVYFSEVTVTKVFTIEDIICTRTLPNLEYVSKNDINNVLLYFAKLFYSKSF